MQSRTTALELFPKYTRTAADPTVVWGRVGRQRASHQLSSRSLSGSPRLRAACRSSAPWTLAEGARAPKARGAAPRSASLPRSRFSSMRGATSLKSPIRLRAAEATSFSLNFLYSARSCRRPGPVMLKGRGPEFHDAGSQRLPLSNSIFQMSSKLSALDGPKKEAWMCLP